jgi:Carboxypeptidase regulatory-like domain
MGFWLSCGAGILLAAQTTPISISTPAPAPPPAPAITGRVIDGESGAPLAEAVVAVTDLDRVTLTDAEGRYTLDAIPPGPQHVVVRRLGYSSETFHALVPRQGTLEIHVALRPEPIQLDAIEMIEVRGRIPLRGFDSEEGPAYPDHQLTLAAIRHDPMSAEPDVLQATGGAEIVLRPETPSGIHIRGGSSDHVAYLLDDIPVFSPYHAAGTFGAWSPDALSRLDLVTSSPPPDFPDALSGVIAASTRPPGDRFTTQGSLSTTQVRAAIDGPLGQGGAGYLASFRSTFPGLLLHPDDPSYLRGESLDWIGKLETPLLGGGLRLLSQGSESELDAAAAGEDELPDTTEVDPSRNTFAWENRSFGAAWTWRSETAEIHLRGWSAHGDAWSTWRGQDSLGERLSWARHDEGFVAIAARERSTSRTAAGARLERSRTSYELTPASSGGRTLALAARTPVVAPFIQHARHLAGEFELEVALAAEFAAGGVFPAPSAQLRWRPTGELSMSAGYARHQQFVQSLRNPESVVSNIFPADLYLGAGPDAEIPVARSDNAFLALEHRPTPGIRFGGQVYARSFDDLTLVAPHDDDPFATNGFVDGAGTAYGVGLEAGVKSARYGIVMSYGLQHVRRTYAELSYVPEHGATHAIESGLIVFPSPTSDIRLAASSMIGRRTTAFMGPFEWEACNLLDQGCEFAGSPDEQVEALGATQLPAYVRLDLSLRKHWHMEVGGRDGSLAVFGTATNILGRRNVLAVTVDPQTGARGPIEMRPRSPLVVGIDWRF